MAGAGGDGTAATGHEAEEEDSSEEEESEDEEDDSEEDDEGEESGRGAEEQAASPSEQVRGREAGRHGHQVWSKEPARSRA